MKQCVNELLNAQTLASDLRKFCNKQSKSSVGCDKCPFRDEDVCTLDTAYCDVVYKLHRILLSVHPFEVSPHALRVQQRKADNYKQTKLFKDEKKKNESLRPSTSGTSRSSEKK